jgi:hypothetical protein
VVIANTGGWINGIGTGLPVEVVPYQKTKDYETDEINETDEKFQGVNV